MTPGGPSRRSCGSRGTWGCSRWWCCARRGAGARLARRVGGRAHRRLRGVARHALRSVAVRRRRPPPGRRAPGRPGSPQLSDRILERARGLLLRSRPCCCSGSALAPPRACGEPSRSACCRCRSSPCTSPPPGAGSPRSWRAGSSCSRSSARGWSSGRRRPRRRRRRAAGRLRQSSGRLPRRARQRRRRGTRDWRSGSRPLLCVLAVGLGAIRYLPRRVRWPSSWRQRVPWRIVAAALVAVWAGQPVVADRPRGARRRRSASAGPGSGHLLSAGGSNRVQYWEAAVDAFASKPVTGIGAGNFVLYWNAHPEVALPVSTPTRCTWRRSPSSGSSGLLLVLGFLPTAAVAGWRARAARHPAERSPRPRGAGGGRADGRAGVDLADPGRVRAGDRRRRAADGGRDRADRGPAVAVRRGLFEPLRARDRDDRVRVGFRLGCRRSSWSRDSSSTPAGPPRREGIWPRRRTTRATRPASSHGPRSLAFSSRWSTSSADASRPPARRPAWRSTGPRGLAPLGGRPPGSTPAVGRRRCRRSSCSGQAAEPRLRVPAEFVKPVRSAGSQSKPPSRRMTWLDKAVTTGNEHFAISCPGPKPSSFQRCAAVGRVGRMRSGRASGDGWRRMSSSKGELTRHNGLVSPAHNAPARRGPDPRAAERPHGRTEAGRPLLARCPPPAHARHGRRRGGRGREPADRRLDGARDVGARPASGLGRAGEAARPV